MDVAPQPLLPDATFNLLETQTSQLHSYIPNPYPQWQENPQDRVRE